MRVVKEKLMIFLNSIVNFLVDPFIYKPSPAAQALERFIDQADIIECELPSGGISEVTMTIDSQRYLYVSWYTGMSDRSIHFGKCRCWAKNRAAPISRIDQDYLTDIVKRKSRGEFNRQAADIAEMKIP